MAPWDAFCLAARHHESAIADVIVWRPAAHSALVCCSDGCSASAQPPLDDTTRLLAPDVDGLASAPASSSPSSTSCSSEAPVYHHTQEQEYKSDLTQ